MVFGWLKKKKKNFQKFKEFFEKADDNFYSEILKNKEEYNILNNMISSVIQNGEVLKNRITNPKELEDLNKLSPIIINEDFLIKKRIEFLINYIEIIEKYDSLVFEKKIEMIFVDIDKKITKFELLMLKVANKLKF